MSSAATLRVPVIGALPGTTVEPTPGQRFVALPADNVIAPVAIAQLVPQGGGTYRLMAQIAPRWFAVTEENFKTLGIGISRKSMIKLIRAGFVEGQQTLPQVHQFDYHSWLDHLAASKEPGFWERLELRGQPAVQMSNREWLYRATLERY